MTPTTNERHMWLGGWCVLCGRTALQATHGGRCPIAVVMDMEREGWFPRRAER